MKNLFLMTFLMLCLFFKLNAQDFVALDSLPLVEYEQYVEAETKVLECCNYLLTKSYDKKDENRLKAADFIIRWMEGTPEYSFEIDQTAQSLTDGKTDLLQIYIAAMTKIYLTTKGERVTVDEIKEKTVQSFIEYCVNEKNDVKLSKELKKIAKERALES